jgi:peptidylprolyl isomerase
MENDVPGAKHGDTVRVHYTGTLEDETVFDSSRERDPLEFTIGDGSLIPGFEAAVVGLSPGDQVNAQIPAEEAYGDRREDLLIPIEIGVLPEKFQPHIGQRLSMRTESGQVVEVEVVAIDDGNLTVDANHPLAGRDLNFEIELVEIV